MHKLTRELVDRLFNLGLSISYDRVLRLSAEMGNSVCQRFHMQQVVCPPIMWGSVFTTAAVDNIDHNPSATTAKDSFHGTGISLVQHPTFADEGVDHGIVITGGNAGSNQKLFISYHISTLMYHLLHPVSNSQLFRLMV